MAVERRYPMSFIRSLALGVALAVGAGSVAHAADVDAATIAAAKTPAQHQALADQFKASAAEATQHSEHHTAMGKQYLSDKFKDNAKHCERLSELYAAQAKEFTALANAEAALAK